MIFPDSRKEPQESDLRLFEHLAIRMSKLNGFTWGQPWKQPELYSVNGEASDWMYEEHGIIAMSPEVCDL